MKKFLSRSLCLQLVLLITTALSGVAFADTLNPDGTNPHENAPRKKISQAQKDAAWEAKKKKIAEIEARKKQRGQQGQPADQVSNEQPNDKQENNAR